MRRAIQGAVFALVLLGGCANPLELLAPYPETKFDCEERDCTRCVPIEGPPHPKGHLCTVTRDPDPLPRRTPCEDPGCVGDCQVLCKQVEPNGGGG